MNFNNQIRFAIRKFHSTPTFFSRIGGISRLRPNSVPSSGNQPKQPEQNSSSSISPFSSARTSRTKQNSETFSEHVSFRVRSTERTAGSETKSGISSRTTSIQQNTGESSEDKLNAQTQSQIRTKRNKPARKPIPVDPEYTNYLSQIVDDDTHRQAYARIEDLDKESRRAALRAKQQAQIELAQHNAAVAPTGESRRVRRWLARNKKRRTRADRRRNKEAHQKWDDDGKSEREQIKEYFTKTMPEEEEEFYRRQMEEEGEDTEQNQMMQEHQARMSILGRKELAAKARAHMTSKSTGNRPNQQRDDN